MRGLRDDGFWLQAVAEGCREVHDEASTCSGLWQCGFESKGVRGGTYARTYAVGRFVHFLRPPEHVLCELTWFSVLAASSKGQRMRTRSWVSDGRLAAHGPVGIIDLHACLWYHWVSLLYCAKLSTAAHVGVVRCLWASCAQHAASCCRRMPCKHG